MTDEINAMSESELYADMQIHLKGKPRQRWTFIRSVSAAGKITYNSDGSIECERGSIPEIEVLRALVETNRRRKLRRSEAAKKAAKTKAIRRRHKIYDIANRLEFRPGVKCEVCGKKLSDDKSRERGIGTECWQDIMKCIESIAEVDRLLGEAQS